MFFFQVDSVNHAHTAFMHRSSLRYSRDLVYSPSNSSLIIRPPSGTLSCTEEPSDITLPIWFAASNQTNAKLHVQVRRFFYFIILY